MVSIHTGPALMPPTISPTPSSNGRIVVQPGSSVEVRCSSNVPYAIISWQRVDQPDNLPEGIDTYMTELQTSVLSISRMEADLYGQYRCQVSTSPPLNEGPLSMPFTLFEPGKPMEDSPKVVLCYFQ